MIPSGFSHRLTPRAPDGGVPSAIRDAKSSPESFPFFHGIGPIEGRLEGKPRRLPSVSGRGVHDVDHAAGLADPGSPGVDALIELDLRQTVAYE